VSGLILIFDWICAVLRCKSGFCVWFAFAFKTAFNHILNQVTCTLLRTNDHGLLPKIKFPTVCYMHVTTANDAFVVAAMSNHYGLITWLKSILIVTNLAAHLTCNAFFVMKWICRWISCMPWVFVEIQFA